MPPSRKVASRRATWPAWCLSAALINTSFGAAAQPAAESAPAASAPARAAPVVPKQTGRPRALPASAALPAQPYQPIQKPTDEGQVTEIDMFVGESRVFPAPAVARIAVGNGSILTASALDGKEVILFANGVGTSSLFVWSEDGRYQRIKINISPGDTTKFAREIAAFLTAIPNARTSVIGDKVVVEGDNLSDADLTKIAKLAEKYPQIIDFTNTVGWDQMVLMDVKVVEFPTSVLEELGLKWSSTGGAAVGGIWSPFQRGTPAGPYQLNIPAGTSGAPISGANGAETVLPTSLNLIAGINAGLGAQLNLLAQNGKATFLAQPQLSARNGATASFLAGGEIPYAVTTLAGPTIAFKPYGVKLDIQPRVDRNNIIRAKIDTEVSSIDPSVGGGVSGPGLLSRKTKTEFNLRAGETLVLSGLLQRTQSTDIDKVPFLGDIPILGALFRSKKFQNKETELVVFVTPTIVDARSPGMVERIERTTERLEKQLGEKPFLTDPVQAGQEPFSKAPPMPTRVDAPAAVAPASAKDAPSVPNTHLQAPSRRGVGSTLQVQRDGAVLHSRPTAQSGAVMLLGIGSFVQLGGLPEQLRGGVIWHHVTVGALNGWIRGDSVAPWKFDSRRQPASDYAAVDQSGKVMSLGNPGSASAAAGAAGGAHAPGRFTVALYKLALRVTPDVNAPLVMRLEQGQEVRALPESPRGYWTAVEADGKRGWVASQWLLPVIDAAATP